MNRTTGENLKIEDQTTHLVVRLSGAFSLARFLEDVAKAVQICQDRQRTRIYLDLTALEGKLTIFDRYEMGAQGAKLAENLKVSVCASPETVDPKRFGLQVARNRGLNIQLFLNPEEALSWLLEDGPTA